MGRKHKQFRYTNKKHRTTTTGRHNMTQKQLKQKWNKTYRTRFKVWEELDEKKSNKQQQHRDIEYDIQQQKIQGLQDALEEVANQLDDINDKLEEQKQEKLDRLNDPDWTDTNPRAPYETEEKLDYIALSTTTTATNNTKDIMEITKRIGERNSNKTPHPSTICRWRQVYPHRLVHGQVAAEFEHGIFSGTSNTSGRDGGQYRNRNAETMNFLTNEPTDHKDNFKSITLCQPQVACKDHKSISKRMCFLM